MQKLSKKLSKQFLLKSDYFQISPKSWQIGIWVTFAKLAQSGDTDSQTDLLKHTSIKTSENSFTGLSQFRGLHKHVDYVNYVSEVVI